MFLEYVAEIGLEDKNRIVCANISKPISDQDGKCSSFRNFVSFLTNTGDVSRAIISNFLNYYLTLQRAHSYKWTRYYSFFLVLGT